MGSGGTDEDGDGVGALSSAIKKTPDRRRNHLRYDMRHAHGIQDIDGARTRCATRGVASVGDMSTEHTKNRLFAVVSVYHCIA